MQTIIGLLRHGQTDWNIDMRLQGISDIPLNDHGRDQAKVAGLALQSVQWDLLITSPLSRAKETSQIVSGFIGIDGTTEYPALLERSFGIAEGLSYEQWKETYQNGETAEGSESLAELTERVHSLLEMLSHDFLGKRVLAVSHGALIRRIINIVSNGELPREGERFSNASLTTIGFDSSGWSILNYDPHSLR